MTMEILTEEEMAARVDFARPLKPTEERESLWCIPFEYGHGAQGTRISIAKAREIAADLRANVAEAEKRELRRAFKAEQDRCKAFEGQLRDYQTRVDELFAQVAELTRRLRAKKRRP